MSAAPSAPEAPDAAGQPDPAAPQPAPDALTPAERMRREFSANVSHEMKTPLQVISGYAELMANGLVPPDDVPRFAKLIYDESQAMRALINDVLILSRLDEGAPGADDLAPVDLAAVARRVCGRLEALAAEADVELQVRLRPAMVRGSETLLEQMAYNLVENAIRYNFEGGLVVVETAVRGADALFVVSDTGVGIPADKREKVFERFYRLDKSRSKLTGGTGLGLAIVKHAALYHGGAVQLDSCEDGGSRFTVRISHLP